jgi:FKBP-type peptidyl-prolyl cis-trans isomerase FkpA
MRKFAFAALIALVTGCAGCSKSDSCPTVTVSAPASEVANLKAYLQSAGITATEDARGFFYSVQNEGSGSKPTPCSSITINYELKLTNGNVVQALNNQAFFLSELIVGWQEGLPLIKNGGKIILYLPPSLGYGSTPRDGIPANSILIFTIDLLKVD